MTTYHLVQVHSVEGARGPHPVRGLGRGWALRRLRVTQPPQDRLRFGGPPHPKEWQLFTYGFYTYFSILLLNAEHISFFFKTHLYLFM